MNTTNKWTPDRISVISEKGYPFPVDMMRYDSCIPASERDSAIIRATMDPQDERARPGTVVELVKFSPVGGRHEPTRGRWESFGWRVLTSVEVEDRRNQLVRAKIAGAALHKLPRSNYAVLQTEPVIVIEDLDKGMSVTNDAERVCPALVARYGDKPIFYYDTMGNFDELVHENGEFKAYSSAGKREVEIMGEKRR